MKNMRMTFLGIVLVLLMPLSAQAATLEKVVDSINQLRSEVVAWLEAAKELYLEHLYQENASYPTTVAVNTSTPTIEPVTDKKATTLGLTAIKELLTQQNAERTMRRLAAAPASDTFQASDTTPQPASVSGSGNKKRASVSEGDRYLYMGTLLSPLVYQMEPKKTKEGEAGQQGQANGNPDFTAKAAFGYLQFVSSLGEPIGINQSELVEAQKKLMATTEVGRTYTVSLRSIIAARSAAIDNLLKMYVRRLPIDGLGEKAGMPDKVDASPAEVEHYIATRRTTDAQWYTSMSKASAPTVARETLFVLTEIQQQLYNLGQDNERMLAMLSVMQLDQVIAQKKALDEKESEVRRLLGLKDTKTP